MPAVRKTLEFFVLCNARPSRRRPRGRGGAAAASEPSESSGESGSESADDTASSEADDASGSDRAAQGVHCTSNVRTLALTASLFSLITGLQTASALYVGSMTLLVDSISMGVDSCTYMANIAVECRRGTRCHKLSELVVGGLSLAVLFYMTWDVMRDEIDELRHPDRYGKEHPHALLPWIVLLFACLGIVFDCVSLYYFVKDSDMAGDSANMLTALLHVGADLLRSFTAFVSALLVFRGLDAGTVDSWAAVVVGATILAGGAYGVWALARQSYDYFRAGCGRGGASEAAEHGHPHDQCHRWLDPL